MHTPAKKFPIISSFNTRDPVREGGIVYRTDEKPRPSGRGRFKYWKKRLFLGALSWSISWE